MKLTLKKYVNKQHINWISLYKKRPINIQTLHFKMQQKLMSAGVFVENTLLNSSSKMLTKGVATNIQCEMRSWEEAKLTTVTQSHKNKRVSISHFFSLYSMPSALSLIFISCHYFNPLLHSWLLNPMIHICLAWVSISACCPLAVKIAVFSGFLHPTNHNQTQQTN